MRKTDTLLHDVRAGLGFYPAWVQKGWFDIVLRYRRTMLGPLWMVITTGVMIACLALVAPALFGGGDPDFIPYLTVGIITWNFLAVSIGELTGVFIEHSGEVQNVRAPFSIYIFRILFRNVAVYAHLLTIYVFVAVIFGIWPGPYIFYWTLGLILVLINFFWAGFVLGMLSARYRDIQQVITAILTVGFLLTPVFWDKAALFGARQLIVVGNPFAHALEVLRAPLLGQMPDILSLQFLGVSAIAGTLLAAFMYRRYINRVAFWV